MDRSNSRVSVATGSAGDLAAAIGREPQRFALFLDIDGTLLDLAPTPEAVVVPDRLREDLATVSALLEGALALITGRTLASADALFTPGHYPVAALHGADIRFPDGSRQTVTATPGFLEARRMLRAQCPQPDRIFLEDKGSALALHYRRAPDRQAEVEALMQAAAERAGPDWALQHGKMVVELKPASASKGQALARLMQMPPFAGRRPVAFGDDLTDAPMLAEARHLGGLAIRVGENPPAPVPDLQLPAPADVRACLSVIAAGGCVAGRN